MIAPSGRDETSATVVRPSGAVPAAGVPATSTPRSVSRRVSSRAAPSAGTSARCGSPVTPRVVDHQRVVRSALHHRARPRTTTARTTRRRSGWRRRAPLRRRGDPRGDDGVGEVVERGGVDHREAVGLVRVGVGDEHRVAAADEVEIADSTVDRRLRTHLGREPVARSEHLDRRRGDDELLVAGRDHRQLLVAPADRPPAERHGQARPVPDRAGDALDLVLERRAVDIARQHGRRPAERQQRRREHGRRLAGGRRRARGRIGTRCPARRPSPQPEQHQGRHEGDDGEGDQRADAARAAGRDALVLPAHSRAPAGSVPRVAVQVPERDDGAVAARVAQPAAGAHRRRTGVGRDR